MHLILLYFSETGFNLLGGGELPPKRFSLLQFKIMALRKLLPASRH